MINTEEQTIYLKFDCQDWGFKLVGLHCFVCRFGAVSLFLTLLARSCFFFGLNWNGLSDLATILFADKYLNPSRSVFQGSTQRCRSPAWNLEGSSGCCWRVDLYHSTMLTAICANSPFSKIVHLTLNRERYTFN